LIKINETNDINTTTGQMNLIFKARIFWRDSATWMRAYIISTEEGLEIKDAIMQRLYKLPIEFGNILRMFFGDQVTDNYTKLLSDYITSLKSLLDAQKNGDDYAINESTRQLHENIDQRAAILSKINPFWQESEWKALFDKFLDLTINESTTLLSNDYVRNIEIFDRLLSHTTLMGDYFSDGLYKYITFNSRQPQIPKQWYSCGML